MKAVITSAGKGSRMKYMTSIMPKALLPLFDKEDDGKLVVRPLFDMITESLSTAGADDVCIVIGGAGNLLTSYTAGRSFTFVVQTEPKGFGDAVLRAENFVGNDPFFVHADDGVLSGGYREAAALYEQNEPDGILLVRRVSNPSRYGIVLAEERGKFMGHQLLHVTDAEEKPKMPKSDMAISAVYLFRPKIMKALKSAKVSGPEKELTGGIQKIISEGGEIMALRLDDEKWLNVGDPDSYHKALEYTFASSAAPTR